MAVNLPLKIHTGGLAETNAYFLQCLDGWLAVDAPEGAADFVRAEKLKINALVLTHGHWDHIWDAAALVEQHHCPVYYHRADELLITQPGLMKNFGLPIDLKPVPADKFFDQNDRFAIEPWDFKILHIPGHCPGSICLLEEKHGFVFGGDVLFAGGVGRWDLPGGSRDLLLDGIRKKLLVLPDHTVVYPGHGPDTSIGAERRSNPYIN